MKSRVIGAVALPQLPKTAVAASSKFLPNHFSYLRASAHLHHHHYHCSCSSLLSMDSSSLQTTQTQVYNLAVQIQDLLEGEQPALFTSKIQELLVSSTLSWQLRVAQMKFYFVRIQFSRRQAKQAIREPGYTSPGWY
jgi:hypothetical protein